MEKKEPIKVNATTVLLIITIVIIGVMSYFMYEQKVKSDNEIAILQEEVQRSQATINEMQTKFDNITSIAANSSIEESSKTSEKEDDVVYEVIARDDEYGDKIFATIKAIKNGKIVTKELEKAGQIDETGTLDLPGVGKVAVVTETGGEAYVLSLYKLINNELKEIGTIDMGVDIVEEATYTVENKNDNTVVINAKRNGENVTKEVKMNKKIANATVVDLYGFGTNAKVVMIEEKDGNIEVYRLSQDYTNGKTREVLKAGDIQL